MAIVDFVIIGIILIGAIVGVVKGFANSIFGLIGTLVAAVGAYFLIKPFADFLQSIFDLQGSANNLCASLLDKIGNGSLSASVENSESLTTAIATAKDNLGVVSPIFSGWLDEIAASSSSLAYPITLAGLLAPRLAGPIISVISWIILFILLKILLIIIEKLINKLLHIPTLKTFDRILGLLLGIVKAGLFIIVILTVATFVFPNADSAVMRYILDSKIAVWINSWNPLPGWISGILPI